MTGADPCIERTESSSSFPVTITYFHTAHNTRHWTSPPTPIDWLKPIHPPSHSRVCLPPYHTVHEASHPTTTLHYPCALPSASLLSKCNVPSSYHHHINHDSNNNDTKPWITILSVPNSSPRLLDCIVVVREEYITYSLQPQKWERRDETNYTIPPQQT